MIRKIQWTLILILITSNLNAQKLSREEVYDSIKKMPSFSIYKDNYFISGVPLNRNINDNTADLKYQISFKHLVARRNMPWNTHLFVTYTQKAFWNLYKFSSPFRDINFNPAIGIGKPFFNKEEKINGIASLMINHNSNGRDSIYSRSWNSVNLKYATRINPKTILSVEAWVPFKYKKGNPDLFDYIGFTEINILHDFKPDKLIFELMLNKGAQWDWKGTVRSRLYYNPFKTKNQYFMLEWFAGYAENLINYKQYTSAIRIGYVIKSDEFNFLRSKRSDFR